MAPCPLVGQVQQEDAAAARAASLRLHAVAASMAWYAHLRPAPHCARASFSFSLTFPIPLSSKRWVLYVLFLYFFILYVVYHMFASLSHGTLSESTLSRLILSDLAADVMVCALHLTRYLFFLSRRREPVRLGVGRLLLVGSGECELFSTLRHRFKTFVIFVCALCGVLRACLRTP